jgi:hypothetical protein
VNDFGKGTSATFKKQSDIFANTARYLSSRERKEKLVL